jgi:transposase-like protein
LREVADRFGVSHETVRQILLARRVPLRIHGSQSPTATERRAQAIHMYLAGAGLIEVGKAFGVNSSTIRNWLIAAGIPRRPDAIRSKSAPAPAAAQQLGGDTEGVTDVSSPQLEAPAARHGAGASFGGGEG